MVSIKAVRAASGNPIPRCRVNVWAGGECVRTTNDDGVAVFETISPGTYTVYIEGVEKKDVRLEGEVVLYI
jgi:hypothetical protein